MKGRRKAREGGFWARVGPSVTAGSCLSVQVHGDAYARTHAQACMHACMHVLAGEASSRRTHAHAQISIGPQTKAAFILRVKWHDYLSSELLSIVSVYQPGGHQRAVKRGGSEYVGLI